MKYLLDTCTISHFVKGHPQISQQLKACDPRVIAVSSISVTKEFRHVPGLLCEEWL